jgi:putative hemolysin
LAAIAICLAALAFSSMSEAVLMRAEMGRVRQMVADKRRGARQLARLLDQRQEVLSGLIVMINLSVIVLSAYTTELTIRVTNGSTRWVPVSSLVMIVVILVVCEVAPKTYGLRRAEVLGPALAPLMAATSTVLRPLSHMLHVTAMGLNRHLVVPVIGGAVTPQAPVFSDEYVMEMVSEGEAEGDIAEDEMEMIHGVIEFADKVAREVMKPRTDMVCVSAETSLIEAAEVSRKTGYSRLPVYEDTLDHVVGILYAKDMVAALQGDGESMTAVEVARRPAPVVPESKRLAELLPFMQRNRLHMAIVIDEYGGTAGLVTIEDILEEIFGEIQDEHDFEAEPFKVVDESTLTVDARASTSELGEKLGMELPEGEFDSVGGFILEQLGRLPEVGEVVWWRNLEFTAEAVSENRVQRVRVVRHEEGGEDADEGEGEE